jgi:hypothetical protein
LRQPHSDVHYPAALSAIIGASAGGALGTFGFIAFLFIAPPLHLKVGFSHALFAFLFITVPVPIGAIVGWWQSVRVIRFANWWLGLWAARLQRASGPYVSDSEDRSDA